MGASETGTVVRTERFGEELVQLELAVEGGVWDGAAPGTYLMLSAWPKRDPYLPCPCWARRLADGHIQLLVRERGRESHRLAALRPGDALAFFGPLGRGIPVPDGTSRLLLAGALEGLGCLLSLADASLQRSTEVALVLPAGESAPLLPLLPSEVELLTSLDETALTWSDAVVCVGDAVQAVVLQDMLRAERSSKPAAYVPHVPMPCGVGACYCCMVRTRRGQRLACVDGPDFDVRELLWE